MLVKITCPTCATEKEIDVPDNIFTEKKMGLIKININKDICCDHAFVAFFNNQGQNCGYEKLDVSMDETDLKPRHEQVSLRNMLKDYGDYNLNLMLHAASLGVPVILLHDKYNWKNKAAQMNYIFYTLFPEKYRIPMLFDWKYDLHYHRNPRYDALVIDSELIPETIPWSSANYEFERRFMKKCMEILDDKMQSELMETELLKLFFWFDFLKDYVKDQKKRDPQKLFPILLEKFGSEITLNIVKFLLQIYEYRVKK